MLNQDMVGYSKGTIDAGKPESFGLITDNTNADLNAYLARVIDQVCCRLCTFFELHH
jgi:leucyl aminopeptidase